jgi:hypothetical protein
LSVLVSLLVVVGLVIQGGALALLFSRLGRSAFTRTGAIFVMAAVVFHGLNEILLSLFPDRDIYRLLVGPDAISGFVVWISVGIVTLTIAYLVALGRRPLPEHKGEVAWQVASIRRVFDWRLMLVLVIPLIVITIAGRGYVSGAVVTTRTSAPLQVGAGLAVQFLFLLIAFASFSIVMRLGRRWLLPVLAVQSGIMALVGARAAILFTAAMLLYVLWRVGITLSRKEVVVTTVTVLMLLLVITSGRAAAGRLATNADSSLRLDFLTTGAVNLISPDTFNQVETDLGYRFDGNSFGGMELQSLNGGWPVLGVTPLWNDLLLAVPSFLNPDKTLSAYEDRSEKQYAEVYLGLPTSDVYPGIRQDIIPTQFGATVGFFGPLGMLLAGLFLGIVFGLADRWLLRRLTPSRLLIGVALLYCVFNYEGSWDVYSVTFRGVLVMLPLVWLLQGRRSPAPQLVIARTAT